MSSLATRVPEAALAPARGRPFEALTTAARALDRRASAVRFEEALASLLPLAAGSPGDERALRRIVGDAHVLAMRFEAAIPHYAAAGLEEDLVRLRDMGVLFGRYRLVRRLEAMLPDGPRLDRARYERFLRERALPQVPIGGSARDGFYVDESIVREVAGELHEPVPSLLAATARLMIARGSRHAAKLYVLARLSGDPGLVRAVEGDFLARAAHPRHELARVLSSELSRRGGRLLETIQEGDADDYNPKSAHLFAAELDGRRVVLKEHLRLPTDFSRIDGLSDEREALSAARGEGVVRLEGTLRVFHHELLILEHVPGEVLSRFTTPQELLPRGEALAAIAGVARTLARLHARSIVYLDVKARNVIAARGDGARGATLVDFGMARTLEAGASRATSLLSTPEYVPPEMARELRAGPPADVFQLGILAARLLTGRHPFALADFEEGDEARESELMKFALANLHADPAPGALLAGDPALSDLLARMLDRRPGARPAAAAVAATLGRIA